MTSAAPIRRALATDGPACAAIVDDWINQSAWMPQGPSRAELEVILTDGLPRREAYVIGDPVAGYLSLDPTNAHIWGFYVQDRGQGLGAALLDRAKQGRDRLQLNTHLPNSGAHRFYARAGFERTGDPWVGDDGIPEIRMVWHA